jgi:hypothetical protein
VLVGIGTLAIPGLGPFIAAGPIMAGLAGLGVGGAVGGLIGALVGMGIPPATHKDYFSEFSPAHVTSRILQEAEAEHLSSGCAAVLAKSGLKEGAVQDAVYRNLKKDVALAPVTSNELY